LDETILLGSSNAVGKNNDNSIIARIVGDFTPTSPPPSLESYYLMRPSLPITNALV
jgi:hypothetical protein